MMMMMMMCVCVCVCVCVQYVQDKTLENIGAYLK